MRRFLPVFVFAILAALATIARPTAAKQVTNDRTAVQDLRVRTRSGASLRVVVTRGANQREPVPAVLFYTTYEAPFATNAGTTAAAKGFAGVVVYARGIGTDVREWMPYEHDGADLYDVIDWISRQQWCNGTVGMYGGSYTGFAQWAAARRVHPALKTIVPQVAVMPGYDTPMENNVCASFLCLNWPNDTAGNPPLPEDLYTRWFAQGSAYRSLDALAGRPNAIFQKWLGHPGYDDFWRSLIPTPEEFAAIRIPVLSMTGYFDGAQIGALRYLALHNQYNANAEHYLVIGPYDHRGAQRMPPSTVMGYAIDPAARVDLEALAYDWLDHVLRGGPMPALLKDRINFEVMGADEWRHAPSLAALAADTFTMHLADAVQTVDFTDRQTQNSLFTQNIVLDTLDGLNARVFLSEPFAEARTIAGSFTGQLTVIANKKDMDISIGFYELTPDGRYFFLTRYLGRASYARNKNRRQLLRPGERETIPIGDVRMVSRRFSKGSRLAVALQVNKNPFEPINYGSGKNVYDETIKDAGAPLEVRWLADSYVRVPILK
jgi:predicted acyl esterase